MNAQLQFLRSRRSIRRFKPDPLPPALIERILDTARYAPSAHHLQPWRFVLVETPQARQALSDALLAAMRADMQKQGAEEAAIAKRVRISQRRIDEAPCLIVLCRDSQAVQKDEEPEQLMGVQSLALAALQLLLAAHAEGIGGNWLCWTLYAQTATQRALDLPAHWLPEAMLFLGYPAETPAEKTLKPLDELVKHC